MYTVRAAQGGGDGSNHGSALLGRGSRPVQLPVAPASNGHVGLRESSSVSSGERTRRVALSSRRRVDGVEVRRESMFSARMETMSTLIVRGLRPRASNFTQLK